jgi:hypothetical protein
MRKRGQIRFETAQDFREVESGTTSAEAILGQSSRSPAAGGTIWQLITKSRETRKNFLEENLRRWNSPAVFFRCVAKDPATTKQKIASHRTGQRLQPKKAEFMHFPVILRLLGQPSTSQDWLVSAISGMRV